MSFLNNIITKLVARYLDQKGLENNAKFSQIAVFSGDHIGNQISLFGRYDIQALEVIERLIFQNIEQPETTVFLDIGANIGNHAFHLAPYFFQVHAFEPNPTVYKVLSLNQALTESANVTCHNVGVSNKTETLQLSIPRGNKGQASFAPNKLKQDVEIRSCEVKSWDDIGLDFASIKVSFVKIDVEGFETNVIEGMSSFFTNQSPIVLIEQNAEHILKGSSLSVELLKKYGYQYLYEISNRKNRGRILNLFGSQKMALRPLPYLEKKDYPSLVLSKIPLIL